MVVSAKVLERWCFTSAVLICSFTTCQATAIIAVILSDKLYVAADARVSTEVPGEYRSRCKIVRGSDTCFVSVSAVARYLPTEFDAFLLSTPACTAKSIEEGLKETGSRVKTEFKRAYADALKNHLDAGAALMRERGVEIVVSAMEDRPVVYIQDIWLDDRKGSGDPRRYTLKPDVTNWVLLSGITGEIENAMNTMPRFRVPEDLLTVLERQSRVEATVGPPYSILEITKAGHHWLSPGACPSD
jgi:hypothetical protein